MVELFKIIKGMYDPMCVSHFDSTELSEDSISNRENRYKLTQHHCHYDLRKHTYTNRVIPIWNSLSDYVVSAETINTFKRRLDNGLIKTRCIIIKQVSMASETVRSTIV